MATFLTDGFQTVVALYKAPLVAGLAPPAGIGPLVFLLVEKEVQTPSYSVGKIETTVMRNRSLRTYCAKSLNEIGDFTIKGQWDPALYQQLSVTAAVAPLEIGTILAIGAFFPDGSAVFFNGWIDKFTPEPLKEGEFPLAELKICIANRASGFTTVSIGAGLPVQVIPAVETNPVYLANAVLLRPVAIPPQSGPLLHP